MIAARRWRRSSGRAWSAQPQDYAWRIWDYWERHLDPELFIDRTLKGTVAGKVVLVTGVFGIGLAAAQVRRGGRHHPDLRTRPGQT